MDPCKQWLQIVSCAYTISTLNLQAIPRMATTMLYFNARSRLLETTRRLFYHPRL